MSETSGLSGSGVPDEEGEDARSVETTEQQATGEDVVEPTGTEEEGEGETADGTEGDGKKKRKKKKKVKPPPINWQTLSRDAPQYQMFDAARGGDVEAIENLSTAGTPVNILFFDKRTPLHDAVEWGQLEAVKLLIGKGANVNAQTERWADTPLSLAIETQNKDIVEFLLANGANPNLRNFEGENALFVAVRHASTEIIDMVLAAGTNSSAYNKFGDGIFHVCVDCNAEESTRLILMKGGDLNYQDSQGQTALHRACASGKDGLAKVLHDSGCLTDRVDADLRSAWDLCSTDFRVHVTGGAGSAALSRTASYVPAPNVERIDGACYVCEKQLATMRVLPCRHLVVCSTCYKTFFERLTTCPRCLGAVYAAVKDAP